MVHDEVAVRNALLQLLLRCSSVSAVQLQVALLLASQRQATPCAQLPQCNSARCCMHNWLTMQTNEYEYSP